MSLGRTVWHVFSFAFLYLLLVIALFVGGAYYQRVQATKRHGVLDQLALSQGWTWLPEDDSWTVRFPGTPFGVGDHRKAENVLQGTFRGLSMVAFDYSYLTPSGGGNARNTETHRFAFCALGLKGFAPDLELTPESALGRMGAALGRQDIELESEEFNRRYRVQCASPKFASDVLPPQTMQALLARTAMNLRLSGAHASC